MRKEKNLALIELAAIYVDESANIMESHWLSSFASWMIESFTS